MTTMTTLGVRETNNHVPTVPPQLRELPDPAIRRVCPGGEPVRDDDAPNDEHERDQELHEIAGPPTDTSLGHHAKERWRPVLRRHSRENGQETAVLISTKASSPPVIE